jgi:hypothetical protein
MGELSALSQVRWAINVCVSSRIEEGRERVLFIVTAQKLAVWPETSQKTGWAALRVVEPPPDRSVDCLPDWLPDWLADWPAGGLDRSGPVEPPPDTPGDLTASLTGRLQIRSQRGQRPVELPPRTSSAGLDQRVLERKPQLSCPGASSAGVWSKRSTAEAEVQLELKAQLSWSPTQLKSSAAAEEAQHSWS